MLYESIEPIAPQGIKLGGEVLPFLKDLYQDVGSYLDRYADKPDEG
jgi:hypothetical protein